MAYIDIVNDVVATFNETPLTAPQFTTAEANEGFYRTVKTAIQRALNDIYTQGKYRWQFLYVPNTSITLAPDTVEYPLPADFKSIDGISGYLEAINEKPFRPLSYVDAGTYGRVHQAINLQRVSQQTLSRPWGFSVTKDKKNLIVLYNPDEAYTLRYSYYKNPVLPTLGADTWEGADEMYHVLLLRALYYANLFRDNQEQALLLKQDYDQAIKDLKRAYLYLPQEVTVYPSW